MSPSQPPATPRVALDEVLPARTEVAIIGGGIIGVSTAYHLASRGIGVAVFEKGRLAGEQSSRNWGWVRKQARDPRELPLALRSQQLWATLHEATGVDVGFRACGILYLAQNEKELAGYEAWLAHARLHRLDSCIVRGRELERLLASPRAAFAGGLYTASDGRAEPQLATAALAAAARARGAVILEGCAVRGLDRAAGAVSGVWTERGRVSASSAVLAGGVWSRRFCAALGLELPQLRLLASVLRTGPVAGAPEVSACGRSFAFRKRMDDGYTVANGLVSVHEVGRDSLRLLPRFWPALRQEWPTIRLRLGGSSWSEPRASRLFRVDAASVDERVRTLDPAPERHRNAAALRDLAATFPAFAGACIEQQWAGVIDVTPDAIPVLGEVPGLPGLYVATGFSGHGFGVGPAAGELLADLVTGAPPRVDPRPFRWQRFSDGGRLEFHGL